MKKLYILFFAFAMLVSGLIDPSTEAKAVTNELGNDGYFQGGRASSGTVNMNGTSGTGGFTAGNPTATTFDRLHLGFAGTVADGGFSKLGWRVLGVGKRDTGFQNPSFDPSISNQSQSTPVAEKRALIISEDQRGDATDENAPMAFDPREKSVNCYGCDKSDEPHGLFYNLEAYTNNSSTNYAVSEKNVLENQKKSSRYMYS
ncbi:MAG: hypothetical protein LBB07_01315 [Bifidobacteriaceae bacterium]|jgi:hypothetical protein|nr:hypothetical protein [Bifidobacteriaceae bacterium]